MYAGLGFIDPATAASLASLLPGVNFGIGAGRKEADAIGPTQLAILSRLDNIYPGIPNASTLQLQNWLDELIRLQSSYISFLNDPAFGDGRASEQSMNTVLPWLSGTNAYGQTVTTHPEYETERAHGTIRYLPREVNGGVIGILQQELGARGEGMQPPQVSEGYGGVSLQYPSSYGGFGVPQSGYLTDIPPGRQYSASIASLVPGGMGAYLPLAIVGFVAYTMLRRR
jgi:hypothetical protein